MCSHDFGVDPLIGFVDFFKLQLPLEVVGRLRNLTCLALDHRFAHGVIAVVDKSR